MRRSILFQAICSALDETVTFYILFKGGVELNPVVAWLISITPLLYPICDLALFLVAWGVDEQLIKRKVDLWFLWTAAGMVRLVCVTLSLTL